MMDVGKKKVGYVGEALACAEALRGLGRSGIDHPENFRSSNSERTSQQIDPMTIDVDVDESMAYGLVRLIYVRPRHSTANHSNVIGL